MTPELGEVLRTVSALMAVFAGLIGGMLWLMRATIRAEVQPMVQRIDELYHAHLDTRRRVEHLETRVERLKDDKIDRGEVDARIELGLARVRTPAPRATE